MTRSLHLIVGPAEHGVTRHGVQIATACGHEIVRVEDPADVVSVRLDGVDVVHLPFTDRLFAPTCEAAAQAACRVAEHVRRAGAEFSVTLHDVPHGRSAWDERRRAAYLGVIAAARGVVVNSRLELAAIEGTAGAVHSLRCIELPIDAAVRTDRPATGADVVVLGFVYPDRGYEAVLHALPAGERLVALGRAASGHDELPERLAALASQLDRDWHLTGFVPDGELPARLAAAAVPVAPNERVTASASIGTWLAHGRRPLVPDGAYTRELAARMPGALQLYDPGPDGLTEAIARAMQDPGSTWLGSRVEIGPPLVVVADAYRDHLSACAPPRPESGRDGRIVVPGNRWDLLPGRPKVRPPISVVIPYYDAQTQLDLVVGALTRQTVADRLEVIVADDGSPTPPCTSAAGALPVRVVRQARRGFGAARARNLGALHATGEVLAFLDGDTVPEPGFLAELTRMPGEHADVVTVGRRRHADLRGWTAAGTGRSGPRPLPEPEWLRAAYRDSRNLLYADARSYRFVISAVLAMRRGMFERLGGFDERFDTYGGEDWELAHRAWLAGALLAHVPTAIAWHDGADWAERELPDRRGAKNAELLALTRLLPDPDLRGGGQWSPYVHTIVVMPGDDVAAVLFTARSAFSSGADCGFWLTGPAAVNTVTLLADQRIRAGDPPRDVRARAAVTVDIPGACDLSELSRLSALASERGSVTTPGCTLVSTRATNRVSDLAAPARPGVDLARLFGHHDRSAPPARAAVDLEGDLGALGQPVRHS